MALTPLDIQKMRFAQKMRGYDPEEVEGFLKVARRGADHGARPSASACSASTATRRSAWTRPNARQAQLQEALLRAQRVADEIVSTARQEAQLLVKEAELTGDRIVEQSLEQVTRIEARSPSCASRAARCSSSSATRSTSSAASWRPTCRRRRGAAATLHSLPRNRRK